jgi:uncharacterized protein YecT (DUF1311 family)
VSVIRLAAGALLLLAALPARAQMESCAAAQTQLEMNQCAAREYQKHDAAMNQVYQQLLAKLTDPRQNSLLVEAERAWIAYRDKQCAFQTSGAGGSVLPLIQFDCLDEKTNVHTAELSRQLNCKEGDPSCVP